MDARSSVESGKAAAAKRSVLRWGFFGWAFALAAVPMVYIRSPKMPAALAAEQQESGTDITLFERAYVERLKARQARAVWIGFSCSVAMFTALAIAGSGGDNGGGTATGGGFGNAIQRAVESQRIITADAFARLQDGMTYQQAIAVIGTPGTEQSRTTLGGTTTVMYTWTNDDFSNANAMFQNDRLVSKAQFGL